MPMTRLAFAWRAARQRMSVSSLGTSMPWRRYSAQMLVYSGPWWRSMAKWQYPGMCSSGNTISVAPLAAASLILATTLLSVAAESK